MRMAFDGVKLAIFTLHSNCESTFTTWGKKDDREARDHAARADEAHRTRRRYAVGQC